MFTAKATIKIAAPIDRVWAAITQPALVKQYFFGTDLTTSWQPGTAIFFRGAWEGTSYEDKGIVKHFDPPHGLSYTYLSSWSNLPDLPENYQLISYRCSSLADGTQVDVVQEKIPTQEQADHSSSNWAGVLQAMKSLLEG